MLGFNGLLLIGGGNKRNNQSNREAAVFYIKCQIISTFPEIDPTYVDWLWQRQLDSVSSCAILTALEGWNNAGQSVDAQGIASRLAYQFIQRMVDKVLNVFGEGSYPKRPTASDQAQIHTQNEQLSKLIQLFPSIHPDFLRDQVMTSSPVKHVFAFTEWILTLKRPPPPSDVAAARLQSASPLIPKRHLFRTARYKKGAFIYLANAFPRLWEATIQSVLLEVNHDLVAAHTILSNTAPSFLNTILMFYRAAKDHPDLYYSEVLEDVETLRHLETQTLTRGDLTLARALNVQEHEESGILLECECCFNAIVWEDVGHCESGDHIFCSSCIKRHVHEGIFGTGYLRGKPIRCWSCSEPRCTSSFSDDMLEQVLEADVYHNYVRLRVEAGISRAGLRLIQCPFCSYAEEVDEPPTPPFRTFMLFFTLFFFSITAYMLDLSLWMAALDPVCWRSLESLQAQTKARWTARWAPRKFLIFNCKNPYCLLPSCISCKAQFEAPHTCYASNTESLRLYVEQRLAMHVVRVCPHCQIQFTKSDGCNKMKCSQCQHSMCFLCRKDITVEKYAHFCEHFRVIPGSACTDCNKCNLYESGKSLSLIKDDAIREWKRKHPGAPTSDIVEF